MSNLEKLIRYILLNYPNPMELSKPRLVKLIYLIDWKYTIENGKQYTNIEWFYNNYGPYVNDVIDLMKQKKDVFLVETYPNPYGGGNTDKFCLINRTHIDIEENVKIISDKFMDYTYKLNWSDFINLVYSSYPIKTHLKYSVLDLEKLAKEFKKSFNT
ncbi:Panacea domain-containing protein [Capnocytophaga stomatis]|uniref:Panacea domain-containing protein n=1 Tax=Capnocytophaga stomatis TaxID=1848904 RepID=UPI00385BAB4A